MPGATIKDKTNMKNNPKTRVVNDAIADAYGTSAKDSTPQSAEKSATAGAECSQSGQIVTGGRTMLNLRWLLS